MKFRFLPSLKKRFSKLKNIKILRPVKVSEKRKVKPVVIYAVIILAVLLPAIYILNNRPQKSEAEWFDDGWAYRQRVPISNTGSAQTDFQVSFTLDTAALVTAGKLQSDCDDVRIVGEDGKVLSHWIEKLTASDCNSTTTKIWAKVPSIPVSNINIYLYYGNSSASSSESGKNTFIYFDDFSATEIDPNLWTEVDADGEIARGNGNLEFTGGTTGGWDQGIWLTPAIARGDVTMEYDYQWKSSNASFDAFMVGWKDNGAGDSYTNLVYGFYNSSTDTCTTCDQYIYEDGVLIETSATENWVQNTLYKNRMRMRSSGGNYYEYSADGGVNWTTTYTSTASTESNLHPAFMLHTGTHIVDNFFVRKDAATAPAVGTLATEEEAPGPLSHWKLDEGTGTTVYNSGSSNTNGTLGVGASAPLWQTEDECITGTCLAFDGADDYVDTGIDYSWASTDSFSISAWFNPKVGATTSILGKGTTGSTWEYLMEVTAGGFPRFVYLNTGGSGIMNVVSSEPAIVNHWHHLEVTYDGSTALLYLDGKLVGTDSSVVGTFINRSTNLFIGRAYNGTGSTGYMNGNIDGVKVYDYTRSAAEIKSDFIKGAANAGSQVVLGGQDQQYLSEGLVGYWEMDEAAGNTCTGGANDTCDSSGNGHDGLWSGNTAASTGKYDRGTTHDGSGDIVTIGTAAELNPAEITVSGWFNMSALTNEWAISKWASGTCDSNSSSYILAPYYSSTSLPTFFICDGTTSATAVATTTPSTGTWYHMVGTFKPGELRIYINGVLETTTTTALTSTNQGATDNLTFGGWGGSGIYSGNMDEIRIYNRALSPREVESLYEWAPGPVGQWKFDENTGSSTSDSSTNANNGTITNAIWQPGKFGSAIEFDGSGDFVEIADSASLEAMVGMTIGAWINPKTTAATMDIVQKESTYNFRLTATEIECWVHNGTTYLNVADALIANISANAWSHVACTWTAGSGGSIHVNGTDVTVNTVTSAAMASNTNVVRIGSRVSSEYFNGRIDNVSIYNYSRTQKQIVQDMNAGHPAVGSPFASPSANWKFDEGYGTTGNNSGATGSSLNVTMGVGSSAPSWSSTAMIGKALNFDGSNDYVTDNTVSGLPTGSSARTISYWMYQETRTTGVSGAQVDILNGGANQSYTMLMTSLASTACINAGASPNVFLFTDSVNNTNNICLQGEQIPSLNEWHHIAFTFDGSLGFAYYLDGNLKYSGSFAVAINTNTQGVDVGRRSSTVSGYFDGLLDEVKIYNYELSGDEVKVDYNQAKSTALGSLSTTSAGVADNSYSREFCIPGDSTSCSSPVVEWKLDDNTGTSAVDSSTTGNTGTLGAGSSAPTWFPGLVGGSLSFDGSNDYVEESSAVFPTSAITVEMWLNSTGNGDGVMSYGVAADFNELIILSQETLTVFINGINAGASGVVFNDGNWHHLAVTWQASDGTLLIYKDGALVVTDSVSSGTSMTSGGCLQLGQEQDALCGGHAAAQSYLGQLDEVRIYNYVRTPAQIAWDYNKGAPTHHYKLDECEGTTAYNSAPSYTGSAAGVNGTLSIGATGDNTAAGSCETSEAWFEGESGRYGSSLDFDGTDDFVTMGDAASLELDVPFSLSAWVNLDVLPSTAGRHYAILSKYTTSGPSREWYFSISNANVLFFYKSADGGNVNDEAVADTVAFTASDIGNWEHVGITVDSSGNYTFYRNGRPTVSGTLSTTTIHNGSASVYLGGLQLSGVSPTLLMDGKIDDVRVYKYQLTPAQFKTIYNLGAVNFE